MSKPDPGAFFKNDPKMAALARAFAGQRRWGNVFYEHEQAELASMTSAERAKLEKERKNRLAALEKAGEEYKSAQAAERSRFERAVEERAAEKKATNEARALEEAIRKHVAKQRGRFTNRDTKVLRKVAKMCKWECQGEKCWAHNHGACPFIHKGEPGWNEKSAVPLGSGAGAGSAAAGAGTARGATGKKKRQQRRNSTRRRRQQRK